MKRKVISIATIVCVLLVSFSIPFVAFADSNSPVQTFSSFSHYPYVDMIFNIELPNTNSSTYGVWSIELPSWQFNSPGKQQTSIMAPLPNSPLERQANLFLTSSLIGGGYNTNLMTGIASNNYRKIQIMCSPFIYRDYAGDLDDDLFIIDSIVKSGVQRQVDFRIGANIVYLDNNGVVKTQYRAKDITCNWGYSNTQSGLMSHLIARTLIYGEQTDFGIAGNKTYLIKDLIITSYNRVDTGGGILGSNYNGYSGGISIDRAYYTRAQGEPRPVDQVYSFYNSLGIKYSAPAPVNDADYSSWLSTAVGGFLDFQIFPGFSLAGALGVVIGLGIFVYLLKVFAGG